MEKLKALALMLVMLPSIIFPTTGCSTKVQAEDLTEGITANAVSKVNDLKGKETQAVINFSAELFKKSLEKDKNTLISPLSVLYALSMTANGAEGETLEQMEKVMGMPTDKLNEYLYSFVETLAPEEKFKLSIANSIWFKDDPSFEANKDFLQTNADYYGASLYKSAFDEAARGDINAWVKDKTDGMISEIIDQISKDAVMYLINAIAFDAEWEEIYNEYSVQSGEFTKEDKTKQKTDFMYSEENTYLEDDKAVGLVKYYAGRKYAFAALLPNEDISVYDYVSSLDGEHINDLLSNALDTKVNAMIPKFKTEYSVEMSEILKKMGMTDAFNDSKADLSGIGTSKAGNLYINRVLHKTFIEVNEKGTRAGAATAVEVNAESAFMPEEPPKEVHLDRPFAYMLIDCETNIPIFIGTVMDVK